MTQPTAPQTPPAFKPRSIQCPGCHKDTFYSADNPWRPFCSKRCYSIDLGTWASEGYRITTQEGDNGDNADTTSPTLPDEE